MNYKTHSFRFAQEILDSKPKLKKELFKIIKTTKPSKESLNRPGLNKLFEKNFTAKKWQKEPAVFPDVKDPGAKLDFLKERVGVEVQLGHASFLGIDLLKFQTLSYSNPNLDKIDVGIYIVTTIAFQKKLIKSGLKWEGSLSFEKVEKYLPHFRSAVQVPILVIGLEG